VHTLLQQVLVQTPRVYLTALAAMKTTNHRLISLPVPLITYPVSDDPQLIDATFPFAKYVTTQKEVPGTRLLYPLNASTLRIATSLSTHEKVKDWWALSSGDFDTAADMLAPDDFSTISLSAGELIAIPPQLILSAECQGSQDGSSDASSLPVKFAEVRYISLKDDRRLDFDYWPTGTYKEISRMNRHLLAPSVTGWGDETGNPRKRFKAAIEMRGVWGIGDALLGLMSWHSPLVQFELYELFDARAGNWFNSKFVEEIEERFVKKLATMVETLKQAHEEALTTET